MSDILKALGDAVDKNVKPATFPVTVKLARKGEEITGRFKRPSRDLHYPAIPFPVDNGGARYHEKEGHVPVPCAQYEPPGSTPAAGEVCGVGEKRIRDKIRGTRYKYSH